MVPSAAIALSRATDPITTPVTKFGGKPCWLEAAQWPLGRKFGVPMEFLGQIALADVPSLPASLCASGRVAYLFMTGWVEDDEKGVPSTWDAEAGENVVILQPDGRSIIVPTEEVSVYDENLYLECHVQRTLQEEPEMVDPDSGHLGVVSSEVYSQDGSNSLHDLLAANKLGGIPCFIQYIEYPPTGGPWHFVLQLSEFTQLPDGTYFSPNFGMGQAHVFVSEDGREGRLLWQC